MGASRCATGVCAFFVGFFVFVVLLLSSLMLRNFVNLLCSGLCYVVRLVLFCCAVLGSLLSRFYLSGSERVYCCELSGCLCSMVFSMLCYFFVVFNVGLIMFDTLLCCGMCLFL